jgi:hypothetical protein
VLHFASQLGVCWAELGPYYDSPNEAVIPAVANVAPVPRRWASVPAASFSCCDDRLFAAQEALAAAAVRRDHEAKMTKEAPDGYRRNRTERVARGRASSARPRECGDLDRILGLYGRMVAAGEWRDYAIDFLKDRAVFSIFRRTAEVPIYRIEKNPRLGRRQGAYSVISATGHILRRGHELDRVLGALDRSIRVVAG